MSSLEFLLSLQISIGSHDYTTVPGTFELVTPAPPTRTSSPVDFTLLFIVTIAAGVGGLTTMVLMVCIMWGCRKMLKRVKAKKTSGKVSPVMVRSASQLVF